MCPGFGDVYGPSVLLPLDRYQISLMIVQNGRSAGGAHGKDGGFYDDCCIDLPALNLDVL